MPLVTWRSWYGCRSSCTQKPSQVRFSFVECTNNLETLAFCFLSIETFVTALIWAFNGHGMLFILWVCSTLVNNRRVYRLPLAMNGTCFVVFLQKLSTVDPGVFLLLSQWLCGVETSHFQEQQFKGCSWQWSPLLKMIFGALSLFFSWRVTYVTQNQPFGTDKNFLVKANYNLWTSSLANFKSLAHVVPVI